MRRPSIIPKPILLLKCRGFEALVMMIMESGFLFVSFILLACCSLLPSTESSLLKAPSPLPERSVQRRLFVSNDSTIIRHSPSSVVDQQERTLSQPMGLRTPPSMMTPFPHPFSPARASNHTSPSGMRDPKPSAPASFGRQVLCHDAPQAMIAADTQDEHKTLFDLSARVAKLLNLIDIVFRALSILLTLWSVRIGLQVLRRSSCSSLNVFSDGDIGEVQEKSNRYDAWT